MRLLEAAEPYAASRAANLSSAAAGIGIESLQVIPIGRSPAWLMYCTGPSATNASWRVSLTKSRNRQPFSACSTYRRPVGVSSAAEFWVSQWKWSRLIA